MADRVPGVAAWSALAAEVMPIIEAHLKEAMALQGVSDKPSHDRAVAREMVLALMMGARDHGVNKLWLMQGVGQAVGIIISSQDADTQRIIIDHYGEGVAMAGEVSVGADGRGRMQ